MQNRITVIIPTYNRASFVIQSLQSVLNQTHVPDEIIIVDDGSTDHTAQLINKYSKVIYLYQNNFGISAARNLGIKHATGDWLCFLDSDDIWIKNKIELQLNATKNNLDCSVFYTNEIWIKNGKRINQGKRHIKYSGWIFDKCLSLCTISPSSVMIQKKVFDNIGLFNENLPVCEDYDLWLRISLHYPIHFINQPLLIKNGGHPDQLSRKYFGMDRFRILSLEKILFDPLLDPEKKKLVIQEIIKKCTVYAQGCLKRNRMKEFFDYQKRVDNLLL